MTDETVKTTRVPSKESRQEIITTEETVIEETMPSKETKQESQTLRTIPSGDPAGKMTSASTDIISDRSVTRTTNDSVSEITSGGTTQTEGFITTITKETIIRRTIPVQQTQQESQSITIREFASGGHGGAQQMISGGSFTEQNTRGDTSEIKSSYSISEQTCDESLTKTTSGESSVTGVRPTSGQSLPSTERTESFIRGEMPDNESTRERITISTSDTILEKSSGDTAITEMPSGTAVSEITSGDAVVSTETITKTTVTEMSSGGSISSGDSVKSGEMMSGGSSGSQQYDEVFVISTLDDTVDP